MKWLALFIFFIGNTLMASTNTYSIKMDLFLYGELVSSPNIVTEENSHVSLTTITSDSKGGHFIDVIAKESEIQGNEGILLEMVVGTFDLVGNRVVMGRPQVLTQNNIPTLVAIGGSANNPADVEISLVVERISP